MVGLGRKNGFRVLDEGEYLSLTNRWSIPRSNEITIDQRGLHRFVVYDPKVAGNGFPSQSSRTYVHIAEQQDLRRIINQGADRGFLDEEESERMVSHLVNGGGTTSLRQEKGRGFSNLVISGFVNSLNFIYHRDFEDSSFQERLFSKLPVSLDDVRFRPSYVEESDKTLLDITTKKRRALRPDHEKDLFERYNYAKFRLKQELGGFIRGEPGKSKEIGGLLERIEKIREILVHANLPLVHSVWKNWRGKNSYEPRSEEYLSDGEMALFRAIEKFDFSRGLKFSTYTFRSILNAYIHFGGEKTKYNSRFIDEKDEDLIIIADKLNNEKKEDTDFFIDLVHKELNNGGGELSQDEKMVIKLRYPLNGEKRETLIKVGKLLGIGGETARRIEVEALGKLRETLIRS